MTGPFLLSISVFIFSFFISLFCLVPCGRFSWLYVSFWAHVKNIVSYRIESKIGIGPALLVADRKHYGFAVIFICECGEEIVLC